MARPLRHEADETDRLLALSDGVIAIAITLLVLEITVPEVPQGTSTAWVQDFVFDQWNELVGYALSFLVVGLYWTLNRHVFVHIEEHDRGLIWLNLLFLLFVAFVPYGTSVFSTYPNRFGVPFIAIVLALTAFSLALLWMSASRKQLIEEGITSRMVAIQATRFLVSPSLLLVSAVIATVDPTWAVLTWILLIPTNAVLNSRLVDDGEEPFDEPE